jgi:hypothetical protein
MDTARISATVGRALLVAALASLAACSASKGSTIPDTGANASDAGSTDASSTHDASTTPVDPPAKDASVPDAPTGECSSSTTQTACVQCCSTAHQDGAGAYLVATIDCMCLPENCAKDCATSLCLADAPKNPDAACSTCVTAKNAACAPSIKSACTADPNCVAFDACVGASECTTK